MMPAELDEDTSSTRVRAARSLRFAITTASAGRAGRSRMMKDYFKHDRLFIVTSALTSDRSSVGEVVGRSIGGTGQKTGQTGRSKDQ